MVEDAVLAQADDSRPANLGNYELVRLLGEGTMGQVYQARHVLLGRSVAIKILRPELTRDRSIVQRFLQEARTVDDINHENIVEVIDYVEDEARVWYVMELLQGKSLTALMRGGLGMARGMEILRQICCALAAAHGLGVIHRDLKPDNIFVSLKDGRDRVKVLDFGVAKLLRPLSAAPRSETLAGAIIGTPAYMSPEQAGGIVVDHRSDLYALGTIGYELLTGKTPFDSEALGQLFVQIITQAPARLGATTVAGECIPARLAELVMRCLEKDCALRPQSAEEIAAVLESLLAEAPPRKRAPRILAGLGAAAALLAVGGALAGAAWGLWSMPSSASGPFAIAVEVQGPPAALTLAATSTPDEQLFEPDGLERPACEAARSTVFAREGAPAPVEVKPAKVRPKPATKVAAAKTEGVGHDDVIDPFAR
jgi:serine/threonine-protein kinase